MKVITDHDFHSLDRAQITEEFFSTPEALEIYRFLRDMYHDRIAPGQVPSLELLRLHFPGFQGFPSNDSVLLLAAELRREKVRMETLLLAQSLNDVAMRDPMAALAFLRTRSSEISSLAEVGEDLTLTGAVRMLEEQYNNTAEARGCLGVPFPWDVLTRELQGMQGGQLYYFFGRPKSMKTWVACYMATYAYITARVKVLVYTKEMTPRQIMQRIACCMNKVDYAAFKDGTLSPETKKRVFDNLREMAEEEQFMGASGLNQPYLRIVSDRGGLGGVSWLSAKIREFKPDIVFADGIYLMNDDRGGKNQQEWSRVMHISRDLKLCAQEHNVPIIGYTQANRGADKSGGTSLSDMAYSDALAQDGDGVFYVELNRVVDEQTKLIRYEITLKGTGLREAKLDGIVINAVPAQDFTYRRLWVPDGGKSGQEAEYQQPKRNQFRPPPTQLDPRLSPVR